jgi:hypothetical protein
MVLSNKSRLLILAVVMLASFLTGYVPLFLENQRLTGQVNESQNRLAEVQERLQIATLHNDLGVIFFEVAQDNFGNAREHSTRFFNHLQQATSTVRDPRLQQALTAILNRRDAITSDLVALSPEAVTKLRSLYLEFPRHELTTPVAK